MATLLTTVPITYIILTLLLGIPAIVNFIKWCKEIWKVRQKFRDDAVNEGKNIEKATEAEQFRFAEGESRISALESTVEKLSTVIEQQHELIKQLRVSDMLSIKAWIKDQHEKWMQKGWIDSQALDLLSQRYEIYEKEGGNHWAKKLVDELKGLPVLTAADLSDIARKDK